MAMPHGPGAVDPERVREVAADQDHRKSVVSKSMTAAFALSLLVAGLCTAALVLTQLLRGGPHS
ncbi:MAG: hypothetical protein RLY93_15545 [Sumerlaeia bacterium]